MIVPSDRLLFWTAAFIPLGAAAFALPSAAALAGIPVALFLAVVLLDAVCSLARLNNVRLVMPDTVRLSRDRTGMVDCRIENPDRRIRRIRIGLSFPDHITPEEREISAMLPDDSERATISWPVKASRRGRYVIREGYLETPSEFGFWAIRSKTGLATEIRVYPDVFSERKNLAALFLGRGHIGIHPQRQIGKGRDFEKLREYLPGDSYEDIHWKATAKRGFPVTKIFQIERTQDVYVIIDASRLSVRQTGADKPPDAPESSSESGITVLERFVTAALVMALAAERQGDRFGLLSFSDRILSFIRAKSGKAHYNACRETLYTLQPQAVSPDYSELFTLIGTHLRRRALLIFLTSLDDPVLAESFCQSVHLISRRHLTLVAMIQPENAFPVFSGPDISHSDDIYRSLAGHFLWSGLRETERKLQKKNAAFNTLPSESLCVDLVSRYLNIKRRQIL